MFWKLHLYLPIQNCTEKSIRVMLEFRTIRDLKGVEFAIELIWYALVVCIVLSWRQFIDMKQYQKPQSFIKFIGNSIASEPMIKSVNCINRKYVYLTNHLIQF